MEAWATLKHGTGDSIPTALLNRLACHRAPRLKFGPLHDDNPYRVFKPRSGKG
jgi:hypothetical protein